MLVVMIQLPGLRSLKSLLLVVLRRLQRFVEANVLHKEKEGEAVDAVVYFEQQLT